MSTQDIPTTDEDLLTLDELEAAWNAQADAFNSWDELGIDEIIWFAQQQALARAALAQPEPEVAGPSDEELEALAQELDDVPVQAVFAFARAVLARWGRPAIEPVPEAERLEPEWVRARESNTGEHRAVVKNGSVELVNNGDDYYVETFSSRQELEKFIAYLRLRADEAWPNHTSQEVLE